MAGHSKQYINAWMENNCSCTELITVDRVYFQLCFSVMSRPLVSATLLLPDDLHLLRSFDRFASMTSGQFPFARVPGSWGSSHSYSYLYFPFTVSLRSE